MLAMQEHEVVVTYDSGLYRLQMAHQILACDLVGT